MIGKIARRLGFEQSIAVAHVEDWHIPAPTRPLIELAPRQGAAACLVDQYGRIQVVGQSWCIDLTLAGGARWVASSETERVKQNVVAPGVIETTVQTPSGPVVQRVAAGVVAGEPVAIVEIENTAGVAIAAGAVIRPLKLHGRGFVAEAEADRVGFTIDGTRVVRFDREPTAVAASEDADLLQNMPPAEATTATASAVSKAGAAQVGAVWPLAYTATLRFIVELSQPTSLSASVPSTADVQRGWEAHLGQGMRVDVDELPIAESLATSTRSLLTLWPEITDTPSSIIALSESGFGRDAGRLFELLERCDDDDAVLRSLMRWAQLGEQEHQLEDLERILGRLAQAGHAVARRDGTIAGPAWLQDAAVALGGRLHQIDQPDVAERIQSITGASFEARPPGERLAQLDKERDKRGVWPNQMHAATHYVRAVRNAVIDDAGAEIRLLPNLPELWRGRTIDVLGLPVSNGNVSFGLRWHGPRPALLWEASLAPEAPFQLTVPGIDPDFSTTERAGETLLADPGWTSS
jgi:hypothetical protein